MSSITIQDLSCATPDGETIFEGLTLTFGSQRCGLIGRNGAGKSTLLALIQGTRQPSGGSISVTGTVRTLRQDIGTDPDETVADAFGVRDRLALLARALDGGATAEEMADLDWSLDSKLDDALQDVGLTGIEPDRRLASLSGGQRMRVALAALLFDTPDFVLLDEPTNNLDKDGRALVADVLTRIPGGAIVVSHDRDLLRRMDRIVEVSSLGARSYGGNWDVYEAQRTRERAAAEQRLTTAQKDLAALDRKIQSGREQKAQKDSAGRKAAKRGGMPKMARDAAAQRAETTGGKLTLQAERQRSEAEHALETAQAEVERTNSPGVTLGTSALPAGKTVLTFENVSGGYDATAPVIGNLSFTIAGPERLAIVGPNGSGKSTLLKLATDRLHPLTGTVYCPVRFAFLDQEVSFLDRTATILENFERFHPQAPSNTCRAALARFLFRADAALRPVSALSGGEMLRAGLACVLGSAEMPQLLILDEPTNHLDLASIEAVEAGLKAYDGALIAVSHDEDFLRAIGVARYLSLK